MNRIQLIFNEKWAMTEAAFRQLASLILPAIAAGRFAEVESHLDDSSVCAYALGLSLADEWELDDPALPTDSVCVIELTGTLYSWSTQRLIGHLAEANANPRIAGILLYMNGPGGMIAGIDSATAAIASSPKPVVAYVAGSCQSAHYWLASATRKRLLSSPMSEVGSIGIVGVYCNEAGMLKQMGIDYRTIYPATADLKNRETREIEEHDNEEPYKQHLEKIHALFCQQVARGLGIAYDKESPVFRGATFMGDDAIAAGLADGYSTLEDAAKTVLGMATMDRFLMKNDE